MLSSKLIDVLSDVFNLRKSEINEYLTKNDIANWDSLKQMDLVTSLEQEFDITLEMEEIFNINSIKNIIDILVLKGVL